MRDVVDSNFYLTHKSDSKCENVLFAKYMDMSKSDEVNLDW